jgi:hypothetical protein
LKEHPVDPVSENNTEYELKKLKKYFFLVPFLLKKKKKEKKLKCSGIPSKKSGNSKQAGR